MAWKYYVTDAVANPMTRADRENNAKLFYNYFSSKGFSAGAICGMLGNLDWESSINPGRLEIGTAGNDSRGGGLIGWTPRTGLYNWMSSHGYAHWYDGKGQCALINSEGTSGSWIPTSAYPYSWSEFKELTDPETACRAYMYERERPGIPHESDRVRLALEWFEFFEGYIPRGDFPIWLLYKYKKGR